MDGPQLLYRGLAAGIMTQPEVSHHGMIHTEKNG